MALQITMSNSLDKNLRDQLDGNFGELDKARVNINGYEFNTLADRLDAIEKVAKQLGLPIDPREESEELNG
ncbi:hypothetical protein EFM21_00335 [Leuconostoc falkenbergense]|uniref:hypothetical protein n=1 Tax=Leuconostoc falkenbergense TaxID=2766470 RepID=UPI0021A9E852|nr:hypothetical protein [Leuconostoc falkenbergense]MCT4377626.1 hypothetical protein [Leuconostoc falkenbergense]